MFWYNINVGNKNKIKKKREKKTIEHLRIFNPKLEIIIKNKKEEKGPCLNM